MSRSLRRRRDDLAADWAAIRSARSFAATGMAGDTVVEYGPRCPACRAKLAEYVPRPWGVFCRHCKQTVQSGPWPT